MEEYTLIQLRLPKEFNYELDKWLLELNNVRKDRLNKSDLIVQLARKQLLKEKSHANKS